MTGEAQHWWWPVTCELPRPRAGAAQVHCTCLHLHSLQPPGTPHWFLPSPTSPLATSSLRQYPLSHQLACGPWKTGISALRPCSQGQAEGPWTPARHAYCQGMTKGSSLILPEISRPSSINNHTCSSLRKSPLGEKCCKLICYHGNI